MKLLDVLTAPWAIEPAKLVEIQAIYATHLRGEKIDIAAVEQRLGRPLANEPRGYDIRDGVAILPLEGVIAKRANLMSQISGGVSTQLAERDLAQAMADNAVHSIILAIDSPGGTVDGTQQLADAVRAASAIKPVVAHASGTMASAAYWIGSAASAVYIADGTTNVGSIGVVTKHTDMSRAEGQKGVTTTEIYAGQYKRIASNYAPLSEAGRASIQAQVDYYYSLFVQAVAANRGVSADKVLIDMADGRVFIGQQAIDAGLVDGVSTLDALVAQLDRQHRSGGKTVRSAGAAQQQATPSRGTQMNMTREKLAQDAPELLASILAEGAAQERERIQAVEGQCIAGHEALIERLKYDGKTTAGEAAMAVNAAERKVRAGAAAALASDAPAPLPLAPTASVEKSLQERKALSRADIDAAARAHMAAHPGVDYIAAVKHITQTAGA